MKYLTTTALAATLAATGALAASDGYSTTDAGYDSAMSTEEMGTKQGDLIRSRDITGGAIYTMNEADDEGWDMNTRHDEIGADWNEIGEIEDLVLSKDGKIIGIVAEIGGFLDIADKHVMISVNDLNLVAVDDKSYTYVTKYNEEQLEEMTSVDEGFWN